MNRSIISQQNPDINAMGPGAFFNQNPMNNFETFLQYQIENAVKNMDSQQLLQKRSVSCGQVQIGQHKKDSNEMTKPDQSMIHSIQENADEKSISNTSATHLGDMVQELNGFEVDAQQTIETHQGSSPSKQNNCKCESKENCEGACNEENKEEKPDLEAQIEEMKQQNTYI